MVETQAIKAQIVFVLFFKLPALPSSLYFLTIALLLCLGRCEGQTRSGWVLRRFDVSFLGAIDLNRE